MDFLVLILLGTLVGTLTGLLPGLHVNTLAAVGFAILPAAGLEGAIVLLSIGTVHTIVNILPGTYMGLPDAEQGISMLPAHRLLLAGRGPEAVAASVAASLLALLVAAALAGMYRWSVVGFRVALDASTAPVLIAVVVGLALQEVASRGRRGWLSIPIFAAAAWLGTVALATPMQGPVGGASSPLLPLLGGLFGLAGLSVAFGRPARIPLQRVPERTRRNITPTLLATCLAGVTAVLPGLTSAVAASFVPGIRDHPVRTVAALSAVNTAHAVFALVVWLGTGSIRTGLADAADRWTAATWLGNWPNPEAALVLATVLLAGAAGALVTLALNRPLARLANRIPMRRLAGFGMLFVAGLVGVLCGWNGLLVLAVSSLLGRLPLHVGLRRVHLVGALLGPAIMRAL